MYEKRAVLFAADGEFKLRATRPRPTLGRPCRSSPIAARLAATRGAAGQQFHIRRHGRDQHAAGDEIALFGPPLDAGADRDAGGLRAGHDRIDRAVAGCAGEKEVVPERSLGPMRRRRRHEKLVERVDRRLRPRSAASPRWRRRRNRRGCGNSSRRGATKPRPCGGSGADERAGFDSSAVRTIGTQEVQHPHVERLFESSGRGRSMRRARSASCLFR